MGVLHAKNWNKFQDILESGFPVNIGWRGIGTLFGLFVLASSMDAKPISEMEKENHLQILNLFLKNGLSEISSSEFDHTPMAICALANRLDYIEVLISHGFSLNKEGRVSPFQAFCLKKFEMKDFNGGMSPVLFDVKRHELFKFFLEQGINLNQFFSDGSTPLLNAAKSQDWKLCEWLISNGADVNLGDEFNLRPIFYTIAQKDIETLRVLLNAGANPSLPAFGEWPNHYELCAFMGTSLIWKMLIEFKEESSPEITEAIFSCIKEKRLKMLSETPIHFFHKDMKSKNGFDLGNAVANSGCSFLLKFFQKANIEIFPHLIAEDNLSPYMRLIRKHGIERAIDFGWIEKENSLSHLKLV